MASPLVNGIAQASDVLRSIAALSPIAALSSDQKASAISMPDAKAFG
jgi:hypothetical protein